MNSTERAELAGYLRVYAAEMENGFIYDIGGAFASEAATDAGKSIIKKQESGK